jgi:hypothetical protein
MKKAESQARHAEPVAALKQTNNEYLVAVLRCPKADDIGNHAIHNHAIHLKPLFAAANTAQTAEPALSLIFLSHPEGWLNSAASAAKPAAILLSQCRWEAWRKRSQTISILYFCYPGSRRSLPSPASFHSYFGFAIGRDIVVTPASA